MQRLRKRRIVILGHGLETVVFCRAFRSEYAEITVITKESNYAPHPVLNSIAAGKSKPEQYARSLRLLFSKRKDINIVNDSVTRIDVKERKLILSEHEEPIEFDFLLIAKETSEQQNNALSLRSYNDAIRIRKQLDELGRPKGITIVGTGSQALETAAVFSGLTEKIVFVSSRETTFPNLEESQLVKTDYELRKLGINLFMDSKVDEIQKEKLRIGSQTIAANLVINTEVACIPVSLQDLDLEKNQDGTLRTRLDSSLPGYPRFYVFAAQTSLKDGLGKDVPNIDLASIQHARYLAKILKGKIEARNRYDIDCPAFIYKGRGYFTKLDGFLAVGVVGKFNFKGIKATLLDTILHKWPAFRVAYGRLETITKLTTWLIHFR